MNFLGKTRNFYTIFPINPRGFLGKFSRKRRKKSMKTSQKCVICRKVIGKSQLFFSKRQHKKVLCYLCQKDEERGKALDWVHEENKKTFKWLVKNGLLKGGENW